MLSSDPNRLDLRTSLGASADTAIQCLTVYIPSADRNGNRFDPHPWVEEALVLLSDIGGGATVMPPVDGAWFNPDTGTLIKEKIVLAYTYVQPGRFIRSLPRLRDFLHRMGRQTSQGEVVAEFGNRLYRITTFDTA
jgi:hypothetical protein